MAFLRALGEVWAVGTGSQAFRQTESSRRDPGWEVRLDGENSGLAWAVTAPSSSLLDQCQRAFSKLHCSQSPHHGRLQYLATGTTRVTNRSPASPFPLFCAQASGHFLYTYCLQRAPTHTYTARETRIGTHRKPVGRYPEPCGHSDAFESDSHAQPHVLRIAHRDTYTQTSHTHTHTHPSNDAGDKPCWVSLGCHISSHPICASRAQSQGLWLRRPCRRSSVRLPHGRD